MEADEREGGEQHHRALGEVEHAGRLEDQHEAERDQRIEHAADKPADRVRGRGARRSPVRRPSHLEGGGSTKIAWSSSIAGLIRGRRDRRRSRPCCARSRPARRRRSSSRSRARHAVEEVHDHAHVVLDQAIVVPNSWFTSIMNRLMSSFSSMFMPAIGSSSSRSSGCRERAAELDALLQAVGQLADRHLADVLDLEEVDDLLGAPGGERCPRARPGRNPGPARTCCRSSCGCGRS